MRAFLVLATTVLVGIGIGIAVLSGTPTTSTVGSVLTGRFFAEQLLERAPLPAHPRGTATFPAVLDHPMDTPGIPGLIDLHRVVSTPTPPAAATSEILDHLPRGASETVTGTSGGPDGSASGFVISLPTVGPNEYLAQLVYTLTATSTGTAVRIDAQSVWEPDRPATETVPRATRAVVTGYARTSLANPSSGASSVNLGPAATARLVAALNELPLAPEPDCMEDSVEYELAIVTAHARFEVTGLECAATVELSRDGRQLAPLHDASCALLRAVAGDAPAGSSATRQAASSCQATDATDIGSSTASVPAPPCTAHELRIAYFGSDGAAGTAVVGLSATNAGRTACTLTGAPTIRFFTGSVTAPTILPVQVGRDGPGPAFAAAGRVVLGPGDKAGFVLTSRDFAPDGSGTCPTITSLSVGFSGARSSARVPLGIPENVCGTPATVNVSNYVSSHVLRTYVPASPDPR